MVQIGALGLLVGRLGDVAPEHGSVFGPDTVIILGKAHAGDQHGEDDQDCENCFDLHCCFLLLGSVSDSLIIEHWGVGPGGALPCGWDGCEGVSALSPVLEVFLPFCPGICAALGSALAVVAENSFITLQMVRWGPYLGSVAAPKDLDEQLFQDSLLSGCWCRGSGLDACLNQVW